MTDLSLSQNKKALFDYEVIESFEAGIELTGSEVKSIRSGSVNLKGSHVSLSSGRPMLLACHISPYKQGSFLAHGDPTRPRELFLHKKDTLKLSGKIKEKWLTCIVTELYRKWSLIKARVSLVRGRKEYDKRHVLRDRTLRLEAEKATRKILKEF